ncbi:hemolysin secretion protein D [Phyllobacterium phragmitis]|uniref:Hemolysin secretion protein D n=1 Tax=Phyllobacterium phragmitis TaxID=2670329 RepID=A0A2S9IQX9_9HYPH|nr:HlyD family secretion protein [Phyllobacterium phragmitis]PRD42928.1 hemolysin secretion protein D [Phyllobacterium phragmitis]
MADGSPPLRDPANENITARNVLLEKVAEAPSPSREPEEQETSSPARTMNRRGRMRPLLFALLPIALIAGGYVYVTGGQVVSTDNAYVGADMVGVSTDVSGIVESIAVHENEPVKAGQVLFRLKPASFRIALAGAKAQLGAVRNQILTLKANYQQSLAQIEQAEADISFYEKNFERQQNLLSSAAASRASYDQAKHDLESAQQKVDVAKAQAQATLAQLGGNADQPVEQNPLYLQAKAAVDNAQRELDDTVVRAPFDGVVANVNSLQAGAYLEASQQGFSLVSTRDMWVAASPKETELTYVKPGQPVTVFVDTYPGVEWKGTVEGISPASASSFSLLPAQNTTGNWVKVVQRVPMRIKIDDVAGKPPLRVGMSATVDVETGHARGLPDFVSNMFGHSGSRDHG